MTHDEEIIMEQYFNFTGISSKKKRNWLANILTYCKEIRNTLFPLDNSLVTELEIVEFSARKDKDVYIINGAVSLNDGELFEARSFVAYIEPINDGETRIYLDITREGSKNRIITPTEEYQKKITTSETIIDEGDKILVTTTYGAMMDMTFQEEVSKTYEEEKILNKYSKQLGAF